MEPGFEEAWPGASALATECILNIGLLGEQLAEFGDRLVRRQGIPSRAAFNALAILAGAAEPLPPSAIAARMIVSRPTVTGILGTLERHGLITRLPHQADRRMSLVSITAEGRRRVEVLLPVLHDAEKRWMSCLSSEEQRDLLRAVAALQTRAL